VHQQQQEQRPRSAAGSQTQAEAAAQRPGSLLDGCFDEAAAAGSFQEALQQWRQATSAAPSRAQVAVVGEPAAAYAYATASTGTAQPLAQPQADPAAISSVAAFLQRLTSHISSQPCTPAGAAPAAAAAAAADDDDSSAMELAPTQLDADAAPSMADAQDVSACHGDAGGVADSFDALAAWLQHTEATAAALASGSTRPEQLPALVASMPAGLRSAGMMMGDSVAAAAAVQRLEELLDGLEQLEGLDAAAVGRDGCGALAKDGCATAAAGAAVRVPDAIEEPGT
jgi:hypothetical protein